MTYLDGIIRDALAEFSPKQREVVRGRFGLNRSGTRRTLQEIGDDLSLTRERVRQIEQKAREALAEILAGLLSDFLAEAYVMLKARGGYAHDEHFIGDLERGGLVDSVQQCGNKLRFVLEVSAGAPFYHPGDRDVAPFWYVDERQKQDVLRRVRQLIKKFEQAGPETVLVARKHLDWFDVLELGRMLPLARRVAANAFGDVGLVEWPEITPRFSRDRAYLVLKKHGEPLHFREIARLIQDLGLSGKRVHPQTIHNELIKDPRFVLVGRGTYGLKENGYEGGTVREVIARILEEKGPMSAPELVAAVQECKLSKANTILLNLQNRQYFERSPEGTYRLKTA